MWSAPPLPSLPPSPKCTPRRGLCRGAHTSRPSSHCFRGSYVWCRHWCMEPRSGLGREGRHLPLFMSWRCLAQCGFGYGSGWSASRTGSSYTTDTWAGVLQEFWNTVAIFGRCVLCVLSMCLVVFTVSSTVSHPALQARNRTCAVIVCGRTLVVYVDKRFYISSPRYALSA